MSIIYVHLSISLRIVIVLTAPARPFLITQLYIWQFPFTRAGIFPISNGPTPFANVIDSFIRVQEMAIFALWYVHHSKLPRDTLNHLP